MFLALSVVIGKTHKEVLASLTNYANSVNGEIQQEDNINSDNEAGNKVEIPLELSQLYINEYSVYPDFDGMAATIKRNAGLFNI